MATLYIVIYPSAESRPSIAEIKAGQKSGGVSATYSSSIESPTIDNVGNWPDRNNYLTVGTSYRHALVWSDGSLDEVSYSNPWVASAGYIYYVVGPATGWYTPQATDIISGKLAAGAAATRSGSIAAPTESTAEFTFSVLAVGLTAGDYKIAYVWSDSIEVSDVSEAAFTVAGGATAPTLSGITLINIGTTYGTPRVTITFA